jgi:hypothetical protein
MKALKLFNEQKFAEAHQVCSEEIDSSEAEATNKIEAMLLRGTLALLFGEYFTKMKARRNFGVGRVQVRVLGSKIFNSDFGECEVFGLGPKPGRVGSGFYLCYFVID